MKSKGVVMLNESIKKAYDTHLSVIEIARVLRTRANLIHDLLRKKEAIEPLRTKGGRPDTGSCNAHWIEALKSKGLSFERWCQGWGFFAQDAIKVLSDDTKYGENSDEDFTKIREALARDLPLLYQKIFKVKPRYIRNVKEKALHPSFFISWDEKERRQVAVVNGLVESEEEVPPSGQGLTPMQALEAAERAGRDYRQIKRLQKAVQTAQSWKE
jgi:hypothetical protein